MTSYTKDPNAKLDYAQDWTKWLGDGETITSSTVTVPTGITKDSDTHSDSQVTVWLSGGTAGQKYPVTYRITTNQGRTDERTDRIDVRER